MPTPAIEQPQHRIAHQTRLQVNSQGTRRDHTHQVAQRHSPPVYPAPAPSYSLWLFPAAVIAGLVLLAKIIAAGQKRRLTPPTPHYTAAPSMLTPTELQFWRVLHIATGPRAHVLMKVRLADILKADRGDRSSFARVSQKHVDFLLCDPQTLKPLVGVELDDRSHERQDRKDRDTFVDAAYQSAGVPLVHILVRDRYDGRELAALIDAHLPRAIMP